MPNLSKKHKLTNTNQTFPLKKYKNKNTPPSLLLFTIYIRKRQRLIKESHLAVDGFWLHPLFQKNQLKMQTADSLPMLQMNKGLHSPRWGAGEEGIISKRIALITCLWEISNRNKTTRQNTLKKQTKECRKGRKLLATNTVASQQMIHIKQMEILSVAQVWFLVKLPEVSFLCVSEKAKAEHTRKKGNIKEEKMQESKTKERSRTDFNDVTWNCLEV